MPTELNASSSMMHASLTSSSVANDTGGRLGAIAPLPDLTDDIDDNIDEVSPLALTLTHGDSETSENTGSDGLTTLDAPPSSTQIAVSHWDTPIPLESDDDNGIASTDEVCCCSPLLEFIKQMFKMKQSIHTTRRSHTSVTHQTTNNGSSQCINHQPV